jgi:acetyl-CoA/propionyl-CoA carboxylase biotin carboxyl carrier protein
VRVDAGIREGQEVTAHYDPMLAKVIAHGVDRNEALERLDRALADTVVLGVETNLAFLRRLLAEPAVHAGRLDTGLIDRMPPPATDSPEPALLAAAAAFALAGDAPDVASARAAGPVAWLEARGWRPGARRGSRVLLAPRDAPEAVQEVDVDGAVPPTAVSRRAGDGTIWTHDDGRTGAFVRLHRRQAAEARRAAAERGGATADPELRAPMPGTVTAVLVADGDRVEAGDAVVAIEAMKMEHRVVAAIAGVARVAVAVGDLVARDHVVARIEPDPAASDPAASDPAPSSGAHEAAVPNAPHEE